MTPTQEPSERLALAERRRRGSAGPSADGLAIEPRSLQEFGFANCIRQACARSPLEFLFELPAFDQVPGRRIAALSSRQDKDGEMVFAVLDEAGTGVAVVEADEVRPEIRSFAVAFRDVFVQLGGRGH